MGHFSHCTQQQQRSLTMTSNFVPIHYSKQLSLAYPKHVQPTENAEITTGITTVFFPTILELVLKFTRFSSKSVLGTP